MLRLMKVFQNVEELRCALAEFRKRYNQRWIVQRLGYLSMSKKPGAKQATLGPSLSPQVACNRHQTTFPC